MPQTPQSEQPPADAVMSAIIEGGVIRPAGVSAAPTTDSSEQPPADAIMSAIDQQQSKPLAQPVGWHLGPSGQPEVNDNPSYPLSNAGSRFANSAVSSTGMPADIKDWPEAIASLAKGPKYIPGPLKVGYNLLKGTAAGSGVASQEGLDEMAKSGISDKAGGALKYVIGGIPGIGPNIVKSVDEIERGNYAGSLGTLTGTAAQIVLGDPAMRDVVAAHLDAAGKYVFSKPRVAERIQAGETAEMLKETEENARKRVIGMAPSYADVPPVPGQLVEAAARKALNDNIYGISPNPKPIMDILAEQKDRFQRMGAMEQPGGGLVDIYTRMSSNSPVSMADLHDYYTRLGEYGSKDLPGNVYKAVKATRDAIGDIIEGQYREAPRDPATGMNRADQWEDFRKAFSDMHTHWWDSDSPLYKSMHSQDPSAILAPLVGDSRERAMSYLSKYIDDGANPNAVTAANRLAKGMTQMQLRGLLQASGGLLASYMLRSEGAPAQAGAGVAGALLSGRLVRGWFRTRPSLTSILSDVNAGKMLSARDVLNGIGRDYGPSSSPAGPSSPSNPPSNPTPFGGSPVPNPPSDITPPSAESGRIYDQRRSLDQQIAAGAKANAESPVATTLNDQLRQKINESRAASQSSPFNSPPLADDTLTPVEHKFLSDISDHPSLEPNLKEDIKAVTGQPSTETARLLSSSKPRYGYRDKLFTLDFANNNDKALYTVAQESKNKMHDAFMDHLRTVYPQFSDGAIINMGKQVRESIKAIARVGDPEAGPLKVPQFNPNRSH